MAILEEIPFTNEALKEYIAQAEKRMDYLEQYVSEYRKLKFRIKKCHERLIEHDRGAK